MANLDPERVPHPRLTGAQRSEGHMGVDPGTWDAILGSSPV